MNIEKLPKLKRWGSTWTKTFTRLGKQIAIAVKAGGPEPENNPTLRSVIATCKRENMPKDNIERAIKNAMGKDQSDYKGMTYEGYGPHGIAVFVDTLTDNTTRTVADVRSVFNKFGGNLGTMGPLAFPVRPQMCIHFQEERRHGYGRIHPRHDRFRHRRRLRRGRGRRHNHHLR